MGLLAPRTGCVRKVSSACGSTATTARSIGRSPFAPVKGLRPRDGITHTALLVKMASKKIRIRLRVGQTTRAAVRILLYLCMQAPQTKTAGPTCSSHSDERHEYGIARATSEPTATSLCTPQTSLYIDSPLSVNLRTYIRTICTPTNQPRERASLCAAAGPGGRVQLPHKVVKNVGVL